VTALSAAPAPVDRRLERRLEQSAADLGAAPSVRVGIDLVEVDEVAESVRRFGDRYLNRIFTPHELASCRTGPEASGSGRAYSAESLAARFAAKEAVVKVLRPAGPRPEWRTIEVHRSDGGWCGVRLAGSAADLAAEAHLADFTVSLTHESMMAVAIVMATVRPGTRMATAVGTEPESTSEQRKA
jgi:holo-[acyl-carrier protein] synthase